MSRSRHHVVSRGYQRFFADGERVSLIDKVPRPGVPRCRPAGTKDVFVRSHFNSYLEDGHLVDKLEDEWARIEDQSLPPIRAWIRGNAQASTPDRAGSRDAAKLLAALHFARSYAFRALHDELSEAERKRANTLLPADPELLRLWWETYDAEPAPGDIEALINDRFPEAVGPQSAFAVEQMAAFFNRAIDRLGQLQVQAVTPLDRQVQFVLGDSPFVLHSTDRSLVGSGELALMDAERLFLPLSPHLGVFFTSSTEPDVAAPSPIIQRLNELTWRAAREQVIAHPATDLTDALARTEWARKVGRNDPCACQSGRKSKACCGSRQAVRFQP